MDFNQRNNALVVAVMLVILFVGSLILARWDSGAGEPRGAARSPDSESLESPAAPATLQQDSSGQWLEEPQPVSSAQSVPDEFQNWFDQALIQMNQPRLDSDRIESEITERAQKLSQEQVNYLVGLVLDISVAADSRILASYILGRTDEQSLPLVIEFLSTEYVFEEVQAVHSPEETLRAQERALRIVVAEALIKRARESRAFMSKLREQLVLIEDSFVREYIQSRIEG